MKKKIMVALDSSDVEYIENIKKLTGIETNSEAIRFAIKLLRLILPHASLIAKILIESMNSKNKQG